MKKTEILKTLRSYSMVIVLVAIALLFHILTEGLIFTSMNLTNIILQNSYIVILILSLLIVSTMSSFAWGSLSFGTVVAKRKVLESERVDSATISLSLFT